MLTQAPDQVIAPSAMTEEQLVAAIENRMRAAHLALQPYFLQLAKPWRHPLPASRA